MPLGGCFSAEVHVVQAIVKPFNYAIVDEADSVLIDDCMTPLVLSATSDTVCKEQYVLAHKVRHIQSEAAACNSPPSSIINVLFLTLNLQRHYSGLWWYFWSTAHA